MHPPACPQAAVAYEVGATTTCLRSSWWYSAETEFVFSQCLWKEVVPNFRSHHRVRGQTLVLRFVVHQLHLLTPNLWWVFVVPGLLCKVKGYHIWFNARHCPMDITNESRIIVHHFARTDTASPPTSTLLDEGCRIVHSIRDAGGWTHVNPLINQSFFGMFHPKKCVFRLPLCINISPHKRPSLIAMSMLWSVL